MIKQNGVYPSYITIHTQIAIKKYMSISLLITSVIQMNISSLTLPDAKNRLSGENESVCTRSACFFQENSFSFSQIRF